MLNSRIFSALVRITVCAATTVAVVTGCSKSSNEQPSASVPQSPPPQVNSTGTTVQVDGQTGNTNVTTNGETPDSNVHVKAPFVNVDVNKGDGGIHVNTPWVHINKSGHGAPTNVDVPSTDSNN